MYAERGEARTRAGMPRRGMRRREEWCFAEMFAADMGEGSGDSRGPGFWPREGGAAIAEDAAVAVSRETLPLPGIPHFLVGIQGGGKRPVFRDAPTSVG